MRIVTLIYSDSKKGRLEVELNFFSYFHISINWVHPFAIAVGYLKTAINSSSKFICQIEHCLFNMTGCKRSYNVAHVARYRCLLWRVATCRQSLLPVPVPGCWGRGSAGEGVSNHIKIARLKAHRVAADSKRLSRQLLEYPVNHIIIEGVFQRVSERGNCCMWQGIHKCITCAVFLPLVAGNCNCSNTCCCRRRRQHVVVVLHAAFLVAD